MLNQIIHKYYFCEKTGTKIARADLIKTQKKNLYGALLHGTSNYKPKCCMQYCGKWFSINSRNDINMTQ